MSFTQMVHTFLADKVVRALVFLVIADLLFGLAASVKMKTFRLSFVADLLKRDVLFKLLPYFGVYVASLVAGSLDIVIPGLDWDVIANATAALFMLALVGSLLSSMKDLGIPVVKELSNHLAGPEPGPEPGATTPVKTSP